MNYKDYIALMRKKWIGKPVWYKGNKYTVVDVDYNGGLLIDLPNDYNDTTAVAEWQLDKVISVTERGI